MALKKRKIVGRKPKVVNPARALARNQALWKVRHGIMLASFISSLPKESRPDAKKWLDGKTDFPCKKFLINAKLSNKTQKMAEVVLSSHPNWVSRGYAAHILGLLASPSSIPALRKSLLDKDWAVRGTAAVSLKRIKETLDEQAKTKQSPNQTPASKRLK